MLTKELLEQVQALNDDDKLTLLRTLLNDPALEQYAYDPLGIRNNYELAQNMLKILEEQKVAAHAEIE